MKYQENRIDEKERENMREGDTFIGVKLLEFFGQDGEPYTTPMKKAIGRYHNLKEAQRAIWYYRFEMLNGCDGDFQIIHYEVKREMSNIIPTYHKAVAVESYLV